MNKRRALPAAAALVIAIQLIGAGMLCAQSVGTISGTVKDSSGAVVPGATVTARNQGTGVARETLTDQAGRFVARQAAQGPPRETDIHIDDHPRIPFAARMGESKRRKFSPRISRRAVSDRSADSTLANCEAKLRPGKSLP